MRHLLVAVALTAITLTGCDIDPAAQSGPATQTETAKNGTDADTRPPARGTALAALATLPVKGRAPMTGYDRDQFGTEWDDAAGAFGWSRNGCDTRNDVLARDLQREVVEANGCVVTSGVLAYEPYTGTRDYYFDKHDNEYATDLDTEHIVALGNAWATGAQQWTSEKRAAFANDPINLMMTDPSQNRSKADADAATWLPPNKAFRCSYIARQIRVKVEYGLAVTSAEKAAMEDVLASCPREPLAQPDPQDGYTAASVDPPSTATAQPSADPADGSTPTSLYYPNCDAARADGSAPLYRGDPGYGTHLDGDGDGDACE